MIIITNYIERNLSPKSNQEYLWFVEYSNNIINTEINNDLTENKFDFIDKNNIKKFGLLGNRSRIFYTPEDGIFHIFGNKISFFIKDKNNNIYNLTKPSNDIITYKMGISQFDPISKKTTSGIGAYYFGYKNNFIENNTKIFTQFIYMVPAHNPENKKIMLIRIVSNNNIAGSLYSKYNEYDNYLCDVNIKKNIGIEYEWMF